jgi:hypothetical protein
LRLPFRHIGGCAAILAHWATTKREISRNLSFGLLFRSDSIAELRPPIKTSVDVKESDDLRDVREALNRHGVFFKKTVIEQLSLLPGIERIEEEVGATFGETRVADIVATEFFPSEQIELRLVFECKRTDPKKTWIFFRHRDQRHRRSRAPSKHEQTRFTRPPNEPNPYFVCSEGYEYPVKGKGDDLTTNQDPVFKSAEQLSAVFLGLVQKASSLRWQEVIGGHPNARTVRFAPILVTTAQIVVAKHKTASIETGRIDAGNLELVNVDFVVLKHPFPTPEGIEHDFRDDFAVADQRTTESIYIVRATALQKFLTPSSREFMADI